MPPSPSKPRSGSPRNHHTRFAGRKARKPRSAQPAVQRPALARPRGEPVALDDTDRRLLATLQHSARITNAELADACHLSPSPCWRRVQALEASGVISRYVTLLDPRRVGLPVSVFVEVSLSAQIETILEPFESAVARRPEVMECYQMTGSFDYLLRVVVPDLDAYETFLRSHLTRIPGVASIRSSFALRAVKYRTELPLEHLGAE
jgi:Lrp/AsnC family transcriptional regulator, leucine-responsive regulatory protein